MLIRACSAICLAGLVTPKAQYYRDIVRMGMVIGVLAVGFAAALVMMLFVKRGEAKPLQKGA